MEDDGTPGRGVIRPAPVHHIRTITTTGHITTVPDGEAEQLKAQLHRNAAAAGGFGRDDG